MAEFVSNIGFAICVMWPFFVLMFIIGICVILDMFCKPFHRFILWVEDKMGVNEWEEEYDAEDIWLY